MTPTLLPTWAALRRHATDLRRTIRANGCTETSPDDRDERDMREEHEAAMERQYREHLAAEADDPSLDVDVTTDRKPPGGGA